MGLVYLLLQPAHLEMFPEMKQRLNGEDSSAIAGLDGWVGGDECDGPQLCG